VSAKLTCLSSDQILKLARTHRVIGMTKRTWSFATTRNKTFALMSAPPRYLFRGQTERHLPCYPSADSYMMFLLNHVSYRTEMEFGDPESKKSIVRTLVASASLDGDDLTLVPNYPGITGVNVASPRGFEPRFSP
jgi:hypothetical protein